MTGEIATLSDPQERSNKVVAIVDGRKRVIGPSFNRGESATFGPSEAQLARPTGLQRFLTTGLMPSERFIDADTTIVAFGSCFANNISNYLNDIGYNVATKRDNVAYISRMGDGMVNTYAIRQQFDWAWNNVVPKGELWQGYNKEQFGYDESIRARTAELFDAADVFIITLGLSEIWYDEPTGEVFWRALPKDKFDPSRHKFRVAGFNESLDNLRAIYSLIRERKPEASIVFTVSPIPLAATFRPISCIVANAESKAILRAALGELLRDYQPTDGKLFYFPSYEIVTEAFHHQFGGDRRHVHPHVLNLNMKTFERYYCKTELSDTDLENVYAETILLDRELGGDNKGAAKARISQEKKVTRERLLARHKAGNHGAIKADKSAKRDIREKRLADKKAARIKLPKAVDAGQTAAAHDRKAAKRAERKARAAKAAIATKGDKLA
ncbi:GSCFA domain-containing protein [Methylopila sp. 73B]|uniref:GSCFA domain-containing protein n=1 Tax=Methylopila sp. 73B TaxID=1120792 RepID=UPI0003A0DE59|nr:GSCFA domain-containing protein [Methylopila sp. 73B]